MRLRALCVIALFAWPAAGADPRFERIAAVVDAKMKEHGVPGVALGISYDGKSLSRGFGVTSVENPLPVTESTLFQIGSITKTFTGTLVMRLADEGKVKLDAPVREYLPRFRVQDEEASQRATVRTLLTHMGGWEGDLFDDPGDGDDALARIVDQMASLEQIAPFNTLWSYNNAGFYALGRLIEVVTGKPYEAAVEQWLFWPLKLRQTFIFPKDVMTRRFAVGHAGSADKPVVLRPWRIPRAMHPAGGVTASVDDLLRYAQFHLGDDMRRMQATQVVKHGTDEEMALAWQVSKIGEFRELWHDGATLGQHALLFLVPSKNLAVVLLTNSVKGERLNRDVRRAIAREYLGVVMDDPAPIAVPKSELAEYVGEYTRPFMAVRVTADGDQLMIERVQRQGFPSREAPPPPPRPPAPFAFYAKDRLIGLTWVAGERAEFLRDADGAIGWIRIGGRVARRALIIRP